MKSKIAAIALASVVAATGMSALSAGVSAEWVKSGSSYSYKDDSGKKVTGWKKIDGKKYYFDKKGNALTGWKKINGDTYYFSASKKGQMLTSWAKIGSEKYYFGSDGIMRTGWVKLDGKTYYFGNDGVMRTGAVKIDGMTYKFGESGALQSQETASKTKIPWGKSLDDIADMLDEQDVTYYINDGRLYSSAEKGVLNIYSFNSDEELVIYGIMEQGNTVSRMKNELSSNGYKMKYKELGENGQAAYAYAKSDSVAVLGCTIVDDEEYSLVLYLSPEYSKKLINEGYDKIDELDY